MATLEEKQKYYEYSPADGGSWWRKDPPTSEDVDAFNRELALFTGLNDGKYPRLRAVWGATAMSDITHVPSLKYKAVRRITKGFRYIKSDGKSVGYCKSMTLAEDPLVPWKWDPVTELVEFGRLRWVIERHMPVEELARLGRFENVYSPDGQRVLRDRPAEGVYDPWWWIETGDHKYRGLDAEVMEAVKAMWKYNTETSEDEKWRHVEESRLVSQGEVRNVWAELGK